jgi:SAM-dependent methyltransferase
MESQQVEHLLLPPIRTLWSHITGIALHADPYTGPFEAHYHQITRTQTWDVDPICEIVQVQGGPVLDMGCGWGRLTLRLARAGYQVTAVDASGAALARLHNALAADPHLAARIHVMRGDLTDPDLLPPGRFRVVAMADLSINIFVTDEAVGRLFAAARHALAEDGCVCLPVLDAASLEPMAGQRGMSATRFTDHTGRERLLWFVLQPEPDGPYARRSYFFQDDNAPDGTLRGHATAVRERLWTAETLLPHITTAGLRIVETQPIQVPSVTGAPLQTLLLTLKRSSDKHT